jgi:hypothetical protein
MKIEELQRRLEEGLRDALEPVIPPGLRAVVQLRGRANGGEGDAPAETWSPEAGDTIVICFQPDVTSRRTVSGDTPRRPLRSEDFDPVPIRGEPLSATVIRDRR